MFGKFMIKTFVLAAMIGLSAANSQAADSANFSESYADKVVCTGNKADGYDCNAYPTGKFTATASTSETVPISEISLDTEVTITVGNFTFDDTVGDYTHGTKSATSGSATFILTAPETDSHGNTVTKNVGTVTIKVSAKGISITASGTTGQTPAGDLLLTSRIANTETGSPGAIADSLTIEVQLDGGSTFDHTFTVPVSGVDSEKTATDKGGNQDVLDTVSVRGRL